MIVALYARVSTAKQAEMDLSIPDQVRQVKEWCARGGAFRRRGVYRAGGIGNR